MTAPGDWSDRAACTGDPRFTDPQPQDLPALQATCRACPVAAACRDWSAGHKWCRVYVAGWKAGFHPVRPPWAWPATPGNDSRSR